MGRVMGIDFGDKRIGVALSDPLGIVAGSSSVIDVKDESEAVGRITNMAAEEGVTEIVVGLPVSLSGNEGPQAKRVRGFASKLSQVSGLRTVLWDERFSTAEAERLLLLTKKKVRKRKETRDLIAAVLILQSYLDRRSQDKRSASARPA